MVPIAKVVQAVSNTWIVNAQVLADGRGAGDVQGVLRLAENPWTRQAFGLLALTQRSLLAHAVGTCIATFPQRVCAR